MAKGKRTQRSQTAAPGGKRPDTRTATGTRSAPARPTAPRQATGATTRNGPNAARNVAASTARPALGTGAARRRQQQLPWWRQRQAITVFGILGAVVLIIGLFVALSFNQAAGSGENSKLASTSLVNAVTGVSQETSDKINTGGLPNPLHAVSGQPVLNGPTGKPQVLYVGGEYCPFCAAERWSLIVALSRFGTFSNLHTTTSSGTDTAPNTPTFTFYGSTYQSDYIDFVGVETATRDPYTPLQTPTSDQQALFNKYTVPPYVPASQANGIPFLDFGNQYISVSSGYSPQVLAGYSWDQIAANLNTPNSQMAKNIVGNANYLTAAICKLTNNQPASVCTSPPMQQIAEQLNKGK